MHHSFLPCQKPGEEGLTQPYGLFIIYMGIVAQCMLSDIMYV